MDLGIKGRSALVTGAGGAIGAAISKLLAEEGVKVAVADIDGARAEQVAAELTAAGGTAIGVGMDVIDEASVQAACDKAAGAFGGIGILVNNAGFQRDMRITKMGVSDWDSVVDVILKGAFLCTRAALPYMTEAKWGRIINISSRAHLGNPGQANYSAAKAGLIGFTKSLSLENGRYGVTVNAIAPGLVDTPAVRALAHFDKVRENAEKTLPISRLGTIEDVAGAAAFLASERASYITGEVLHVTGGRY